MRRKSGTRTRRNLLIAVLVLSVIALLWSIFFNDDKGQITLSDFIGLIPTTISLLGLDSEDKKHKKKSNKASRNVKDPSRESELLPSFDGGLYGGLIGGVVTGLILAVAYVNAATTGRLAEIFIYASLVGTAFGALSQLLILWFGSLAHRHPHFSWLFHEISGGCLGGVIGGVLLGALGGWYFGLDHTRPANLIVFAAGIALGPIFVSMGALFYDYTGNWRRINRALIIAVVTTILAGMIGVMLTRSPGVVAFFLNLLASQDVMIVLQGGAILGVLIGAVVGLQVGLTLRFYRLWNRHFTQ